ncbi:MAG: serine/threonine protein kinase, partial [Bryobacterales bacterium]|nr:serine/threonine protein kinase [Bryobacterales bacterium]
MDYISGHTLDAFIRDADRTIEDTLAMFHKICDAVNAAHLRGIVHRDLKPANIRVDGSGEPHILDFGLAKGAGTDIIDGEHMQVMTATGDFLGSLPWSSPEQAERAPDKIDVRTDVYSLGVILYELVAERLPADPNDTGYAAFLTHLAAGALQFAPPAKGNAEADLSWIALKALENDRARRYPSAAALAEDVERYLRYEPVTARRPTLGYRLSKYVRRNRVQAIAASVAIVAVLGGSIAAGAGYVRSLRAEAQARDEAAAAGEVSDFLVNTFKVTDPGETRGRTVTARELLENAATQIETRLSGRPKVKQRLLTSLSRAYTSLGLYTEGRTMAGKALVALPAAGQETQEDADALLAFAAAGWQQDRFQKAREAAQRAVAIRTRLFGPQDLKVADALQGLGTVETLMDQFEPSLQHFQQALAIRRAALAPDHLDVGSIIRSIAGVYLRRGKQGDMKLALEHYRQSLKILEARMGPAHPMVANNLDDIGMAVGKPAEALGWHEKAYAVRQQIYAPDHIQLAFSHYNLGRTLMRLGKLPEARRHLEKALEIRKAKLGEANTQTSDAMRSLAMVEASVGRHEEALRLFRRVVEIAEKAFGADSENTLLDRSNLGIMLSAMKRFEEALPHLRAGLRAKVFFQWKSKQFDPVRNDPRYVALAAEQERVKAGGVPESTFQYSTAK